MTDGHQPTSPPPSGDGASPFVPFVQETQKASRRFRIPPAFLGLLLAVAVAVPTVLATLPPAGQPPSDGGAAPSVQGDAPPDTGSPPATGREPADPAPPPAGGQDGPDEAPAPPAEPPATDSDGDELRAVQDCVENSPDLRASCEIVLGKDVQAAASYLDCRDAGQTAGDCLAALPRK